MELIPNTPDDISRGFLIRLPYTHFSHASSVCKRWKSELESSHFQCLRKATHLAQNIIVMTTQSSSSTSTTPIYQLMAFEPGTGAWNRLPPIPSYPTGLPLFCQCVGVGRSLVVIGGWDPITFDVLKSIHVYDFVSATWRRGADMPGPSRSFFACAASDKMRMVYVAGGHDEEKNALRSAFAYDVKEDKWVPLGDMEKERDECKGIFHHGKFHVIGGYSSDKQGQFQGSVEHFDVETQSWSKVKEDMLPAEVSSRNCVMDDEGNVYNILGDHVKVLSIEDDKWREVIEMPRDVRVGTMIVTWQRKVMVIGSNQYGGTNSCYVLVEDGRKWTKVEEMPTPEEFMGHVHSWCTLEI